MAKVLLNNKHLKYAKKTPHAFDVSKLICNTNITQNFEIMIRGGLVPLMKLNNIEITEICDKFKTTTYLITKSLFGLKRNLRTEGLYPKDEILCQNRREATMNMLKSPADAFTREIHKTLNKKVELEKN